MDYLAYITAVAAFGGLVLGVFNTWKAHVEDKVKLRITACLRKRDDGVDAVKINITNLSKFPVAIPYVGAGRRGGTYRNLLRLGLDQTLDPRRNLAIVYPLRQNYDEEDLSPEDVQSCIVRTECGLKCVLPIKKADVRP